MRAALQCKLKKNEREFCDIFVNTSKTNRESEQKCAVTYVVYWKQRTTTAREKKEQKKHKNEKIVALDSESSYLNCQLVGPDYLASNNSRVVFLVTCTTL
jgi:uncharacterized protein (DUF39 family)